MARTLRLSPGDRCLNVMPLFHIHGLVGALLASLRAGAGFVCTGGYEPTRFFTSLRELGPTWYTAVPTIHQAVLEHATAERIAGHRLRVIRSSSAALPPALLVELEARFGVPVVDIPDSTSFGRSIGGRPLGERAWRSNCWGGALQACYAFGVYSQTMTHRENAVYLFFVRNPASFAEPLAKFAKFACE